MCVWWHLCSYNSQIHHAKWEWRHWFIQTLEKALKQIYEILRKVSPIKMTSEEHKEYNNATKCYACEREFDKSKDEKKSRYHDHITGRYRGAACNDCNMRMQQQSFVPILFHNLEIYDSHLFITKHRQKCGRYWVHSKNRWELYLIQQKDPNGNIHQWEHRQRRKPIPWNQIPRFIKFTLESLDKLVSKLDQNRFKTLEKFAGTSPFLKQKCVFPYEFLDNFDKLSYPKLPPKEAFNSRLRLCHKW